MSTRSSQTALRRFGLVGFAAGLVLGAAEARAWHGKGHHFATRIVVSVLPEDIPAFLQAGAATIAHCAIDPDTFTRPIAPSMLHKAEGPDHYLDLERLDGRPLPPTRGELMMWCGKNDVSPSKVGFLPYAVVEQAQRLTVIFAEHRKWPDNDIIQSKALIHTGYLAHYCQDLCMPLHTTIHYDGRVGADGTSPHSGIHKKVDALLSKLPADTRVRIDAQTLVPFDDIFQAAREELRKSHVLVDRTYAMALKIPAYEEPVPQEGPVAEFVRERLRAAVTFTVRTILTAWADSEKVRLPAWHEREAVATTTRAKPAKPRRPAVAAPPAEPEPTAPKGGRELRVATYNVEHFMRMFDQALMPERSRDRTEYFRDDEDLYEVARTMRLDALRADVIAIQECCSQEMLERFNRERLDGAYEFVKVFPSNVDGQYLGMLARAGLRVLEMREHYHLEPDPVDDPAIRGIKERAGLAEKNLLFSRGPAFVKFRAEGGPTFWVGVTHVKSKYGDSEAVAKWRIREVRRTRDICLELLADSDTDLLLMCGDFNDDFGMDRNEKQAGADAVGAMLEPKGSVRLTCLTRPLAQKDPRLATYHCELKPPKYRSFIDHIFASRAAARIVERKYVVDDAIAAVASDHYPVVAVLRLPK